jgi:tetratricopeptide (TPR) repeat protein
MNAKPTFDRVAHWTAGIGPLLFFGVATVEGSLRAGYDPIADPISALALGPRGWVQQLNFALLFASLFSFVLVLRTQLRQGAASIAGPGLFFLMTIGIALAGSFTMDAPGAPLSLVGRLHLVGGFLFFPSMPVALLVVARRFRRDVRWQHYFRYTLATGLFCLAALIFFLLFVGPPEFPRPFPGIAGMVQRLQLLPFFAWMALVTRYAYREAPTHLEGTMNPILRSRSNVVLLAIGFAQVACSRPTPAVSSAASETATEAAVDALGGHSRKVTTTSAEAQRRFDDGLAYLYAFNHDEAIRSFEAAAAADPTCAMAYWGVGLANGPHINFNAVPPERAAAATAALAQARRHAEHGSEVERALIDALATRYRDPQPEDRKPLDTAYAAAMRAVARRFPGDADANALFAEALMDLRPWDYYAQDGTPHPETTEALSTLEAVMTDHARHPLALHLYIHVLEMSPTPERADAAADRLRELAPGLGHLVHMPSHIDVRRGRWAQAITANRKAIEADRRYRERAGKQGFYSVYMAHNHHMLGFAAMMTGRRGDAVQSFDRLVAEIPPEFLATSAALVDGYMAMPLEARMRFGDWEGILAAPELPEYFPISRALRHQARGVAFAAIRRVREARAELDLLRTAAAGVPQDAAFGNNAARDLLQVAELLLEGEVLYREGKVEEAIAKLERGAAAEDRLRYDEPPDWIQPVRHALGAVLLEENRFAEAERVFRADLAKLPDNGWSLFGLARSLEARGEPEQADRVRRRLKQVWAHDAVELESSCMCLQ